MACSSQRAARALSRDARLLRLRASSHWRSATILGDLLILLDKPRVLDVETINFGGHLLNEAILLIALQVDNSCIPKARKRTFSVA